MIAVTRDFRYELLWTRQSRKCAFCLEDINERTTSLTMINPADKGQPYSMSQLRSGLHHVRSQ